MPKAMPDLAGAFARATDGALDLALAGELARLKLLKFTLSVEPLHLNKLDLLRVGIPALLHSVGSVS